jgi:hypothetical protein
VRSNDDGRLKIEGNPDHPEQIGTQIFRLKIRFRDPRGLESAQIFFARLDSESLRSGSFANADLSLETFDVDGVCPLEIAVRARDNGLKKARRYSVS